MSKQIKIGTQVRISPNCRFAKFHREKIGLSGIVVSRCGKTSYTIDFGGRGQIVLEPKDMIITSSRSRGYSHPKSPNMSRVNEFTKRLHGSGINYDWHIDETKSSFRVSNNYDTMNEVGMYDSVVPFTVIFPKGEPMENFKLQFGSGSDYQVKKYMLREYLRDTIASVLNELNL